MSLFINTALANDNVDTCKQIMVVGDINWPPYAIQEELPDIEIENIAHNETTNNLAADINGIGIELVKQIFAELDIPVQVVQLDNRRNIFNGLHVGDIDVLVSTYANKDVEEEVDVIKPGYLLDPVVVYMRKGTGSHVNRWDDLIGKRGVKTAHFLFASDFEEYVNRYLYVHSKGDLAKVIELVDGRKADYIIGSKLQLEHGVKYAGLQDSIELIPNVSHPDEVHMGYSKASSCRMYLPYLRRRLLDLKADGTVDEIVAKYLAKDNIQEDEQDNSNNNLPINTFEGNPEQNKNAVVPPMQNPTAAIPIEIKPAQSN
jgi:ABC-type amino acid transport substrate-binding protein